MESAPLAPVLEQFKQVVGAEHVLCDAPALARYTENVTAFERNVPAVVFPASTDEVRRIVLTANEFKTPLYPLSTGRNWGLGSRLPVADGSVVVDLKRMRSIREVNVNHHYAVVEPGVTQAQLYEHLGKHALPLLVNVTGSGKDTSLIGNALERGIGYFSSRADSLSGLEVVLGTGEVLRTGCGHYADSKITYHYKHGVGPSLDGLFSQSGFGIVTSAAVDLIPEPEAHMAVVARIDDHDKLPDLIDALADLRRREVIRTVVHVGNRYRSEIALAPLVEDYLRKTSRGIVADQRAQATRYISKEGFGPWSAVAGILGSPAQLKEARRQIARAMGGLAETVFLTDRSVATAKRVLNALRFVPACRRKRALLGAVEPLYGLSKGIPTDEPVKSVYWPVGDEIPEHEPDPDQSHSGMLYCLPFAPLTGRAAKEMVDHAGDVVGRFGFVPFITLNLIDSKVVEAVINIAFDRNEPERVSAAHECIEVLQQDYIGRGYIPYRVGIDTMSQVVNPDDRYWQMVQKLKRVFDPNNIVAPGRYDIP